MIYIRVTEILKEKRNLNIGLLKKWKVVINHLVT